MNKEETIGKRKEYSTLREDYIYFCNDCDSQMEGIYKNYCDNCGRKQS